MRSRQRVLTLATSAWLVAIATVDAQIATSTTGTRDRPYGPGSNPVVATSPAANATPVACVPCSHGGGAGPTAACVPCIESNWNRPFANATGTAYTFALRTTTGPRPQTFCGVELYTRTRSQPITVTVSLYDSGGPWSGKLLASGSVLVGTSLAGYTATFASPVLVPASSTMYVVFDQGLNIYMPAASNGVIVPNYWWHPSYGWQGPYSTGYWCYRVLCQGTAASYTTYGAGCRGLPRGCQVCLESNWKQNHSPQTTSVTKIANLQVNGATRLDLCGVDFESAARTAPQDVTVAIHDWDFQTGLPGKVLGTTRVRVAANAVQQARFTPPISIAASTVFFVVLDDASTITMPLAAAGDPGIHYEWKGSSWVLASASWKWRLRLLCDMPAAVPVLSSPDRPLLGTIHRITLDNAKPSSAALLFLGVSDQSWGSLQLPFDLAPYATGCKILASLDLAFTVATDVRGGATLSLPIPNNGTLLGLTFFNQFFAVDPKANALWMVASNAGKGIVGDL